MNLMRFEWDRTKAATNIKKHRISFEIATRVFADPFVLIEQDRIEDGEQRWQAVGAIDSFTILVVAHTVYEEDEDGIARRIDPDHFGAEG
ncbi:BrnT family toxin [Neorhizobium petrolearium]|uniref:BrnT family toxin n=1 Tax=Neorhizobium petrolearium TaxID=515361 RepID=UPI003F5CC7CF